MFNSLLDILRKVQRDNPALSRRLAEAEALSRWEAAVGPQIAKNSRAIRVQDKTLFVEVDHPIWKQELQNRKRQILDKLNQAPSSESVLGDVNAAKPLEAIEDIYFFDPRSAADTATAPRSFNRLGGRVPTKGPKPPPPR